MNSVLMIRGTDIVFAVPVDIEDILGRLATDVRLAAGSGLILS
jgi:hypothetical protein